MRPRSWLGACLLVLAFACFLLVVQPWTGSDEPSASQERPVASRKDQTSKADPATVERSASRTRPVLKATDAGHLQGHLLDVSTGVGVPGLQLQLYSPDRSARLSAESDADGRVRFRKPFPIKAGQFVKYAIRRGAAGRPVQTGHLRVSDDFVITLRSRVTMTARIVWRIGDSPPVAARVGVSIYHTGGQGLDPTFVAQGETDSDGKFHLSGRLRRGASEVIVAATHPSFGSAMARVAVARLSGPEVATVVMEKSEFAVVCADTQGHPVPSVQLFGERTEGRGRVRGSTDATGRAVLRPDAGPWRFLAAKTGFRIATTDRVLMPGEQAVAPWKVVLQAASEPKVWPIEVFSPDGQRVVGAIVTVKRIGIHDFGNQTKKIGRTDASGRVELTVDPDSDYSVRAFARGVGHCLLEGPVKPAPEPLIVHLKRSTDVVVSPVLAKAANVDSIQGLLAYSIVNEEGREVHRIQNAGVTAFPGVDEGAYVVHVRSELGHLYGKRAFEVRESERRVDLSVTLRQTTNVTCVVRDPARRQLKARLVSPLLPRTWTERGLVSGGQASFWCPADASSARVEIRDTDDQLLKAIVVEPGRTESVDL